VPIFDPAKDAQNQKDHGLSLRRSRRTYILKGANKMSDEFSETTLAKMKRVPVAKRARAVSGLSQSEFAHVYGIPIGTLRDWEQERCHPDAAGVAYLTAITNDPEAVARAYGAAA
jgi:putative transcriptional regulator